MNARAAVPFALLFALAAACGGGSPSASPTEPASETATDAATPSPVADPPGTWRILAPMLTPRAEVAVAALDGKIYVIGGFEADGSPSAKVEVYDPVMDAWSEAAPLPETRHHAAAVPAHGGVWVIGGFGGSGFREPKTTVFEFTDKAWVEQPGLVTGRGAHAAVNVAGTAVVVGGAGVGADGDTTNIESIEWMDSESHIWRKIGAPLPVPRDHLAAASVTRASGDVLFDQLYVIGGRRKLDYALNVGDHESTNPFSVAQWTPRADIPTARSGIAAVAFGEYPLGKRVFFFGGESPEGTFDKNEVYDPESDSWQTMAPMPTARHGLGAAVVGGTIYVIGGGPTPGLSVTGANEAYTPP